MSIFGITTMLIGIYIIISSIIAAIWRTDIEVALWWPLVFLTWIVVFIVYIILGVYAICTKSNTYIRILWGDIKERMI